MGDILHAEDFGAIGDGVTDDTAALVSLLAQMQAQGKPGMLGSGSSSTRYLVQRGALVWTFDNDPPVPGVPGPTLYTSGAVTLVAKPGSPDAPLLYIHNDPTSTPGVNRYVHGGYVGALTFEDTTVGAVSNSHGLKLYGVQFMSFGMMSAFAFRGDVIHIEQQGDGATADAWHVNSCRFDGVYAYSSGVAGWAFNNNSVGQVFSGNWISAISNLSGLKGAYRGVGASNTIQFISINNCGSALVATGEAAVDLISTNSTCDRFTLIGAELDAPQCIAMRLCGINGATINETRITWRELVEGTVYPPKGIVFQDLENTVGGAGSPQHVQRAKIDVLHRITVSGIGPIESEAELGNLFEIIDADTDATFSGNVINHTVSGMTVSASKLTAGLNSASANTSVNRVTANGVPIFDHRITNVVRCRISSGGLADTATAPSLISSGGRIIFDSQVLNDNADYNIATGIFTARCSGRYRISATITVAADTDGDEIQLCLSTTGGSIFTARSWRANGTGVQSYTLDTIESLVAGTAYQVTGRHSGSGNNAFAAATGASINQSNTLSINQIQS